MTLPLALLLLACSSDSDGPPSFVIQPEPVPEPSPAPAPAPLAAPPAAMAVVFEQGVTGGVASDLGAQRIAMGDGASTWSIDHVAVVSDSAYHERSPAAVPDGAGGFIAVYEAEVPEGELKGDLDLLAQRLDADGLRAWGEGTQSIVLASTGVVERAPTLVRDSTGGAYVLFERHGHDEQGNLDSDLAGQHLGHDGKLLWAEGSQMGLPIATGPGLVSGVVAVADGMGGLLVVFELEPVSGPNAGSHELWAHRIAPFGAPQWGNDGLPIAVAKGSVSDAAVLPDGEGGALVVFREEVVEGQGAGDFDLMVQRVAPDGTLPWSGDPQAYKVVSATTLVEHAPAIVSDGAGGVIVAYQAQWIEGPRAGQLDLFAQRIDASGTGLWNDGAPVPLASSDWTEHNPVLVTDGAGGAIAVFSQAPPSSHLSGDQDIYAQRLGPDGSLLWHDGAKSAVLSATTHLERNPSAASDGAGGVVVFFEAVASKGEFAGDSELVAQRMDAAGKRLWGEGTAPKPVAWGQVLERNPVVVVP